MKLVSGPTKLARFMRAERISARYLAGLAGISYKYILRLCSGRSEPTRPVMLWIAEAVCYVIRRRVEVSDLFDLEVVLNERFMRP